MIFQVPPHAIDAVVGEPAPVIAFKTLSGATLSLKSFRGKILVLTQTSFHCGPCHLFEPRLQKLAANRTEVVFLEMSCDDPSDFRKLAALHSKRSCVDLVAGVIDPSQAAHTTWTKDQSVPCTWVIDEDGNFASRGILGSDDEQITHIAGRIAWAENHAKKPSTP